MRRSFARLTPRIFQSLYGPLVRSHLEYAVQAWSPYLQRDIDHLERVQRLATRMVYGLRSVPYEERLLILGLPTLAERRLRGDLITTFRIQKGLMDVDPQLFFTPSHTPSLRGHPLKLFKHRSHTRRRAHAFSMRVINPWNKLPNFLVDTNNVGTFKKGLDENWNAIFLS